ncbi:MAG TPA: NAD(P)H-binding protein [Solirubrobacteraceae bacterium]|nr:NAD(P)H-binding protein [Solirubrobacteraceae bacterium]
MLTLVTGVSGYVGSALVARLQRDGLAVRGFARSRERVDRAGALPDELVLGDVTTGEGLAAALEGVHVAYYLIHSMEGAAAGAFADAERRSAERFAAAAAAAGVTRVVYLGGLVTGDAPLSRHLGSRLAVERELLDAVPGSVALRASIVIGARSRSFRFLVRLIERMPVMALPAWRDNRTAPIDGRDVLEFLAAAAGAPAALGGRSWDIGGPDVMTYAAMIARIADALMLRRPSLSIDFSMTPVASVVAAAIAGEDPALIGPLMESLEHDLLPREGEDAAAAFGVRLHGFDAAVERALRDWERTEELAGR